MKPTAHRVRKLVEKYEKEVMNPALVMTQTGEISDPSMVVRMEEIRDEIFDLHVTLMGWYDELSPKQ